MFVLLLRPQSRQPTTRKALLLGTAWVCIAAITAAPALAAGGKGGEAALGNTLGGDGGSAENATGIGTAGSPGTSADPPSGGGGGGAGGGTGGAGGGGTIFGAGGAGGSAGANGLGTGGDGTAGSDGGPPNGGGGGGGGGGHGFLVNSTLILFAQPITGGRGGNGGNVGVNGGGGTAGGGGGGGEGGYGVVNTASNAAVLNAQTITGGNGGDGGGSQPMGAGNAEYGGSGGRGGIGLYLPGSGVTITNQGTITGGNGGMGGGANSGSGGPGLGGAGIKGSGLTIDNTGGTIAGGISGFGAQASAIVFTGGDNRVSYTGTINGGIDLQGGSFAPALAGSAIGTTRVVNGPVTFASGTSYNIRVSPAGSDSVTTANDTATLNSATVNAAFQPGSYVSRQYIILTAKTLVGTFGTLNSTNLPSNATASLSQDIANVYLNLTLTFTPPNPGGPGFPNSLNGNQQAVANALIASFNANGGIPGVYASLNSQGLSQAAGQNATGVQTSAFNAASSFLGLMTDPSTNAPRDASGAPVAFAGEDDALAYAATGKRRSGSEREAYAQMYRKAPALVQTAQRWSVWAAGFGGTQKTDGNAALGSATTTSRLYGAAVGADYRVSPSTVLGFALAGGGTNFALNGNFGSGRSDLFQAGVYGRHQFGAGYVAGALAYGRQDVTTDRFAVTDQLRARFDTNTLSARIESGWRFATPWMGITPYAAGQAIRVSLPSYAETVLGGTGAFALRFASRDASTTRSELGLRTDKTFAMGDALLTLRGRAAWAHDFDRDRIANPTFVALPLASFTVNGARPAANAALVTASAETNWRNGWSTSATFEGEFSNVTRSYAGKGVVKYTW